MVVWPQSGLIVEQRLRRFRDELGALARSALEEEQALAEDEAIEQERLRVGFLRLKAGCTIELRDVLEPRGIDAGDGRRRSLVRTGPLPDRQLDRHALGV